MVGLGLAALFIFFNGFFVAAEFALVKLRATHGSRKKGVSASELQLQQAVERLDKYLGVTQLAITLASLGLGWIGEPAMTELGNHLVESVWGRPLGSTGQGVVVAIAFSILTLAHVLFGELVPKLVAIQRSKQAAAVTVPLLRVAYVLLYPGLWVLEACSRAVLKLIKLPFDAYGEAALSEDEILGILAANVAREPRGEQKHELMRRVVRFSARTAKAVMIPRVDVASLPVETPGGEAIEFVRQQQYSRVLLHKGDSLDDVVGYLYAKDLVFDQNAQSLPDLRSIRRDVLFVPETQGLLDVLRSMQQTHTPFAVVVDEYGGTSGIATMEDLLEEIVGDIRDELDEEAARIEKKGMAWEVDGRVTLGELGPIGVDAEDVQRGESVGAVVMARLKRLPRVGDKVDLGGMTAEVMHIARRRVTRVRVQPASAVEVAKS
jgi:CBS domain containing-hemolysin-like protein